MEESEWAEHGYNYCHACGRRLVKTLGPEMNSSKYNGTTGERLGSNRHFYKKCPNKVWWRFWDWRSHYTNEPIERGEY